MTPNNVLDQLARDEGYRSTGYKDSRGYLTVGIGFLIDPTVPGAGLSLEECEAVLALKVNVIRDTLNTHLPWFSKLDHVRQEALVNMTYNMGFTHLIGFHNMLSALEKGDLTTAAAEMANSAWYKQVGDRAERLRQQIATGEWQ